MTTQEYKTIIQNKYQEITKQEIELTDEQFDSFCGMAKSFGSGQIILDHFEKYLKEENTDINGFINFMVEMYLEFGGEWSERD